MKLNKAVNRLLEIIPGLITWLILTFPVFMAIYQPVALAVFILIFDLYWIFRASDMAWHLISGWQSLERAKKTNWQSKLDHEQINWRQVWQAVIIPVFNEPVELIIKSIESIAQTDYPKSRKILVLAVENREGIPGQEKAQVIRNYFRSKFAQILTSTHFDQPDELKGKGANITAAGLALARVVRSRRIDPSQVLVTVADSDTRFHRSYFLALGYNFLTAPKSQLASYQPIPIFSNNIWSAPFFSRLLSFATSFWHLIESARPWRLFNSATHAMSLKSLIELKFWDTKVVNEDSRQFWRAFYKYGTSYRVIPIFIPVYMDSVVGDNFWSTVSSQYKQRVRWGYMVEHFPYIVRKTFRAKHIPVWERAKKIIKFSDDFISLATTSIFIGLIIWLPFAFNPNFNATVIGSNLSFYASRLLALSWILLAISVWISVRLIAPMPKGKSRLHLIPMLAQWLLVPISAILFSSIPAIHAQTRLMFGRYLEFEVTPKPKILS